VSYAEGVFEVLPVKLVARCGLLRDISGICGSAELPFAPDEFRLWQERSGGGNVNLHEACVLLKVCSSVQSPLLIASSDSARKAMFTTGSRIPAR
jgi:hypothetical protein